jgi:hypothetical protein
VVDQVPAAQKHVKGMLKGVKGMPVDVKVDFLKPTLETMQEMSVKVWNNLPPQVQQAAPFVAVGAGTGLVVFIVQQRRVNHHKQLTVEAKEKVSNDASHCRFTCLQVPQSQAVPVHVVSLYLQTCILSEIWHPPWHVGQEAHHRKRGIAETDQHAQGR